MRVDQDPVAGGDATSGEKVDDRLNPRTDNREIAVDAAAPLRDDAFDASVPFEPGHDILENRDHALVAMNRGHDLPHLFAEDSKERRGRGIDGDHLDTFLAERRGDFGADESHADDGIVEPGMLVEANIAGDKETFLLGSREVAGDTDLDVYSEKSPLGAAIQGHKAGDTVKYTAPNGKEITVEVLSAKPYAG